MIVYNPTDGDAFTTPMPSVPRQCFLATRLGHPTSHGIRQMGEDIKNCCQTADYRVIDATTRITGRDFLIKIWKDIASSPLVVGVAHEDIPPTSQANIYYEIGVAQALGKETVIVKSRGAEVPSDFIRTEYVEFDKRFRSDFLRYMKGLSKQAEHYELVAKQLDRNPILALDYLKRAYLITGNSELRAAAKSILEKAGIEGRALDSVEHIAATF